jgi:hypothetical protein
MLLRPPWDADMTLLRSDIVEINIFPPDPEPRKRGCGLWTMGSCHARDQCEDGTNVGRFPQATSHCSC